MASLSPVTSAADVAELLTQRIPEILRLWEERTRAPGSPAGTPELAARRELLGEYLRQLAEELGRPKGELTGADAGTPPAPERAVPAGTTLDQVIRDYHLLRRVLVEVLERDGPLPPGLAQLLEARCDAVIEQAASAFVHGHEQALWESEEWRRRLMETAQEGTWVADADGRLQRVSQRLSDMLGRPPASLLGHPISDLVFAEDRPVLASSLRHLRPDTRRECELRLCKRDGSYLWARLSLRAIPVGVQPDGHLALVLDVTDRKRFLEERAQIFRREQEARAQAERSEAVLRSIQYVTDAALAHLDLNRLLHELLARVRKILTADTATVLLLETEQWVVSAGIGPDSVGSSGARVRFGQGFAGRVAATGRPLLIPEVTAAELGDEAGLHGAVRSLLGVPLLVEGTVKGVLQVGTFYPREFTEADTRLLQLVADRVALAIDRARLFGEAQQELSERQRLADELRLRMAELREADQRKDEFLATLAHELRNPLAPLLTAVPLLRAGDAERRERLIGIVQRQATHLAHLVDDLLDVSRITRDQIALKPRLMSVGAAIVDAVQASRPLIEARGHRLSVSIPPEPIYVHADPTRLEQIVVNLLNNAAKYTEPGGEIGIRVETGLEGETPDRSTVRIHVRDTGRGIPPEMLPQVFELFTQVDPSLDRAQGGLGLGLTLVRRLAEMHGGSVSVRSEGLGHGTEFVVTLPVVREVAPVPLSGVGEGGLRAHPPGPPPSDPSTRVLVVDDNMDAAQTLAELLELWGYTVEVAYDGPAALSAAAAFRPDVVLLDIGLPGLDGYEVARRMRLQPAPAAAGAEASPSAGAAAPRPKPRIIALTGYGQPEDQRRAREAGFDRHVTKPVDPDRLRELLEEDANPDAAAK